MNDRESEMQEVYETVKIHDKYQFEAKFTYPLDRRRDTNEYQVDTYMFLPNNLYINKRTYSADDFYEDLHKYIRFGPRWCISRSCPLRLIPR